MKFSDIRNAVKHLLKNTKCVQCQKRYDVEDVSVIATAGSEGLFELVCENCNLSTMVTMTKSPTMERKHKSISEDDVLDIKNFLNKFDGNFKKIFTNKR